MPVRVVAHRGFSGIYPENTEIAFRRALELGVDTIEFDLRLTYDNHLVAIHDPTVDRTSDGSGAVSELTLEEIKALDAGSWVAVSAGSPLPATGLGRLLRRHKPAGVHLAVRCTALVARGYIRVCADADGTAFGQVPP